MKQSSTTPSPRQKLFEDMVVGTLVYAVVLGFFEDYTNILTTWSYSTTFLVAVVMQLLTYATFWLKSCVVKMFKGREGKRYVAALVVGVWAIMFFSKFVFLGVINFLFTHSVELSGFIGLGLIVAVMTITRKLIDILYQNLSEE